MYRQPAAPLEDCPNLSDYLPSKPGILSKLRPGWRKRHEEACGQANAKHAHDMTAFQIRIAQREAVIKELEASAIDAVAGIDRLRADYESGSPEAVAENIRIAFAQSEYPEAFPLAHRVGYSQGSSQLVVDIELPTIDAIVPAVERYKYVKSKDEIVETKKPLKARQDLYSSVIAQTVLRHVHEVFKSDRAGFISVAVINAYVDAIDPSTGRRVHPCLLSVRTTRDAFEEFDLRHVDPIACLKRLHASVSRSPAELAAVKPIVEFDMTDPRFIEEADVLSTLDSRPNLMELSPSEFESLITNLFQKMGLETKLTQASRDGGVDCVAFDPRPVLGGKVVVQAKRYKNTVGVSAVRDLYGTLMNEGASKGILVTTSGYGSAAFNFANGKPLELFSGGELLFLLKEHAGIDAKIVIPDGWADPTNDI
ncbi:MAG: restriction endonuclease [Hyphomicrobium sp.]